MKVREVREVINRVFWEVVFIHSFKDSFIHSFKDSLNQYLINLCLQISA